MAYNDLQLRAFTQIAYMDLEADFEKKSIPSGTPVKLSELLTESQKQKLISLGVTEQEINTWKISGVHNTNDANGFYACVIETSPGNAAVGFRGSEGMGELNNVVNDWVGADIGLVNSTCTNQQAEVDRFLAKYRDLLDGYGNLTMTGHSLGGNLAEYATIVSSQYGLDDNISQCASLDGPGFSDEFIRKYRKEIEQMSDRMTHYRWSFVGTMLNDLPGVDYKYVSVSNEANALDGDEYSAVTRHDTKYLDIDPSTGMFMPGKQDNLSKITSVISEGIDHMPPIVGDVLVTVVGGVWIGAMWTKEQMFDENGNLTPAGYAIIGGAAIAVAVIGIPTVITTLLTVVVVALAVVAVAIVFELAYDLVVTVINAICDAVEQIYKWGKEIVSQLRDAAVAFVNGLKNWFNKNFNNGYKYASSHPQVTLDTYKLRSYAQRLMNVNRRISNLDRRMDGLYWQVGLLDLWNLMQADLLTGYSWRIYNAIVSGMFESFLPVSIKQKRKETRIECSVQGLQTINQYFSGLVSKKMFLDLAYQIALIIKGCEKNMVVANNLDLQKDRVFIDPITKTVKCIYWPVVNNQRSDPPHLFLKQLPYDVSFSPHEDNSY